MPRKFDFIPPRRQKPAPAVRPGTILQVVEDGYSYTVGVGGARIQLFTQPAKDAANNLAVGDLVMARRVEPHSHLWLPSPQAPGKYLWCSILDQYAYRKPSPLTSAWVQLGPMALGDGGAGNQRLYGEGKYCFNPCYFYDTLTPDWGIWYTVDHGITWQKYKGSFGENFIPDADGDGGYCLLVDYSDFANRIQAVDRYNPNTDSWAQVMTSTGGSYGAFGVNLSGVAMRGQYAYVFHVWPEQSGGNDGRRWKIFRSTDYGANWTEVYSAWEAYSSPPGANAGRPDLSLDGDEFYIPTDSAVNNAAVYVYNQTAGTLTGYPTGVNAAMRRCYARSTDSYVLVGSFSALNSSRLNKFDRTAHTYSAYSPAYNDSPVDAIAFVEGVLVVSGYTSALGYHVKYADAGTWVEIRPSETLRSQYIASRKE